MLFELVFPKNDFIPKPSVLSESFVSLFEHYFLFGHLSFSIAVLLFGVLFGFLIFFLLKNFAAILFPKTSSEKKDLHIGCIMFFLILIGLFRIWNFIPFWFEFVFAALFTSTQMLLRFSKYMQNKFPAGYNSVITNLKISDDKIINKIKLKSFLPDVVKMIGNEFPLYFVLIIIYEFVINNNGLGTVFSQLLTNKDLSGFFAFIILLILIWLLLKSFIDKVFRKFIFWEATDE
jgi:ABC-type nitrate/sulfonate/bicarbonate transport system permease component